MDKSGRFVLLLLCVLCVLMSADANAAPDIRTTRSFIGRIEQGSTAMMGEIPLLPDDCTGFTLRYRQDLSEDILAAFFADTPAPKNTDMCDGMVSCLLDETTARRMFEDAYAVSIGPDGSILWFIYFSSRTVIVVQHDRTLVLTSQSFSRGAADTNGSLKNALSQKMNINSEPVEGEVRWSPDSRYLFFNDTDRWLGAKIILDDPYIIDTQTGEIFLIESSGYPKNPSDGIFRCVLNGRFSMDSRSFYWYCRNYTPGDPPSHCLMRYDLGNGTDEVICELDGSLKDFCEIKTNCWFLLETAGDGINLVRMFVSSDGIHKETEYLPIPWSSCSFLPVVREKVLLAVNPLPSGGTYLLPLDWDTPASSAVWQKLGSLSDNNLQKTSMEEIEAELQDITERNSKGMSTYSYLGTARMNDAAALIGMPHLLLTVEIRESVPDSWGGGFQYFNGQVILNTENLAVYPIRTTFTDVLQDPVIDGNRFLVKNYGQVAVALYSVEVLPEVQFEKGQTYISPFGTFTCRNENDPLVLTSVTLKNRECGADIIAAEEGYSVTLRIVDHPEPELVTRVFLVPEALTENRWNEIMAGMGKKDQKKLSGLYTKIIPGELEKRSNQDEILACYPAAATETLYILKSEIKTSSLEMAEAVLSSAGYSEEDYRCDMELAVIPQLRNVVTEKTGRDESYVVSYAFSGSDPTLLQSSARAQALAGLCDLICRSVVENSCLDHPLPVAFVILEKYVISNAVFHVTVEHAGTTENTIELSLTVKLDY